jgi:hypothetical protein
MDSAVQADEDEESLRWNENQVKPVRPGHFDINDINPDDCPQPPDLYYGSYGMAQPQCPASTKAKFTLPFNDGQFKCKFKVGERGAVSGTGVMSFFVVCSPSDKDDWKPVLSTGRVGERDSAESGPFYRLHLAKRVKEYSLRLMS